jgi:hypothetical protein
MYPRSLVSFCPRQKRFRNEVAQLRRVHALAINALVDRIADCYLSRNVPSVLLAGLQVETRGRFPIR